MIEIKQQLNSLPTHPLTFVKNCLIMSEGFLKAQEMENLQKRKCVVDFDAAHISLKKDDDLFDPVCKTVACHAGWAAIFLIKDFNVVGNTENRKYDFTVGVSLINTLFGFDKCFNNIQTWAKDNPELWLSQHGDEMFTATGYRAFNYPKSEITLKVISDHWYVVAESIYLKYSSLQGTKVIPFKEVTQMIINGKYED